MLKIIKLKWAFCHHNQQQITSGTAQQKSGRHTVLKSDYRYKSFLRNKWWV